MNEKVKEFIKEYLLHSDSLKDLSQNWYWSLMPFQLIAFLVLIGSLLFRTASLWHKLPHIKTVIVEYIDAVVLNPWPAGPS